MQILDVFRSRQSEEHQRYNGLLSLQRGHALVIRKKWRQLKQFLTGPRGAWAHRCVVSLHLLVERVSSTCHTDQSPLSRTGSTWSTNGSFPIAKIARGCAWSWFPILISILTCRPVVWGTTRVSSRSSSLSRIIKLIDYYLGKSSWQAWNESPR